MVVMRTIFFVVLLLSSFVASAEEKIVGVATLDFINEKSKRALTSAFWFEAIPGSKIEWFAPKPPIRAIPISPGAKPRNRAQKFPLVLISHGNWGTRYSLGWLASRLVKEGYVVLSVSHPGTTADDQSVAGRYRLWDRSTDISFVLDELQKNAKWKRWADMIDMERIAFAGHSFGGWTGVSLAGGIYDPAKQRQACKVREEKDLYCEVTLKDDVSNINSDDAIKSYKDDRIKAYYIMGTGPSQGFSDASLKGITAAFMIDGALKDVAMNVTVNTVALSERLPTANVITRQIGHFTYVPQCKWLVGPVITWIIGLPICDDPSDVDRGKMHKIISGDVVAFFNRVLVSQSSE